MVNYSPLNLVEYRDLLSRTIFKGPDPAAGIRPTIVAQG